MASVILGCDPGLVSGALAAVRIDPDRPRLIAVLAVPTTGERAKKRVDVLTVMEWIRQFSPDHAFVERAQSFPKQGISSAFNYGRATGALETCIMGLLIPHTFVEAAMWKRHFGLIGSKDKEDDRQRALGLFPEAHAMLARKKHHNAADASLVALYGALRLGAADPDRARKPARPALAIVS
jgi:Holliday junction resolvasome RuvABC endonuclease subunit